AEIDPGLGAHFEDVGGRPPDRVPRGPPSQALADGVQREHGRLAVDQDQGLGELLKGLLGERSLPPHAPQYMHWGTDFRLQLLEAPFELERNGAQDPLVEADVADRLAAETSLETVETEPGVIGRRFLRNPPPIVGIAAEGPEVAHR